MMTYPMVLALCRRRGYDAAKIAKLGYEIRELGTTPAGEIAVGMAIVNQTLPTSEVADDIRDPWATS